MVYSEVLPLRDKKYEPRHFQEWVHMMIAAVNPFAFYIIPIQNEIGNKEIKFYIETIGPTYLPDVELRQFDSDNAATDTMHQTMTAPAEYFNTRNRSKIANFSLPYFSITDPPTSNIIDTLAAMCLQHDAAIVIGIVLCRHLQPGGQVRTHDRRHDPWGCRRLGCCHRCKGAFLWKAPDFAASLFRSRAQDAGAAGLDKNRNIRSIADHR